MEEKILRILDEKLVERTFYMNKIKQWLGTPMIKVIVGQRRVGKSFLLKQTIQYLVRDGKIKKDNIFYLNCEDPEYDKINTNQDLNELVLAFIKQRKGEKIFVGIDEIQRVKDWEKTINGIQAAYPEVELFITGSNSHLLSGELATYLSGRYIEIKVYPLSYNEFLQFHGGVGKTTQLFAEFLNFGGLPGIFDVKYDANIIMEYERSVYDTVVLKDVFSRKVVSNPDFFHTLYKYVLGNIGNIFSAKSITDYLKSQEIKISIDSVMNYLSYGEDVYMLYKVKSQDLLSRKWFGIYNKYYAGDLGLRNAIVGYQLQRDIGFVLENYVFLLLKKYGYEVSIGRFPNGKEVDFVVEKNGLIRYFQVATTILDQVTADRENSSLEAIKDTWPKYILTMDDLDLGYSREGIKHCKIQEFEELLELFDENA